MTDPPRILGPVMLNIEGTQITAADRRRLLHPLTGGVILFSRNYQSVQQLRQLVEEFKSIRTPSLLVAVDQEGGRVQRFREAFTPLPKARQIGSVYQQDAGQGRDFARAAAVVMATEIHRVSIDFSFVPVLDVDTVDSQVIGDRAFDSDGRTVTDLAMAYLAGLQECGMAAVGKHFPGHGSVSIDSHKGLPIDRRSIDTLRSSDLVPYRQLIDRGMQGVLAAHVRYPEVCEDVASFSPYWLRQILRKELAFDGAIFTDDLSMGAAEIAGDVVARSQSAINAGNDMILVCNDPMAMNDVLSCLDVSAVDISQLNCRLDRMRCVESNEKDSRLRYETARDRLATFMIDSEQTGS